VTTLAMDGWTNDFERINRHRALAELVIHNHNWLPWWVTTSILGDYCDQAERFLRGEGLPPFPVRLWWAYKHWKFRKAHRAAQVEKRASPIDTMQQSKITGDRFTPAAMIPLPEGQSVRFIPVVHKHGHEIEVTDMKTGKRRKVFIDDAMLNNIVDPRWHEYLPDVPPEMRKAVWFSEDDGEFEIDCTQVRDLKRRWVSAQRRPTDLGSFPRPNCPKCHTPHPELGTPLDKNSESGWGDSYFTCSNHDCRFTWKWKKVFPLLVENNNKQGTVTGTLIKGTDVPFHIFGQAGATIEQVNEAVRKIANVAGISMMTPEQQLRMQEIIQENSCRANDSPLAKLTPSEVRQLADRAHRH
jgi:hypothetical protein